MGLVDTIVRKFNKYQVEQIQRDALLQRLSDSATPRDVRTWEALRQQFEEERISDPSAGDRIFGGDLTQSALRTCSIAEAC